MKTFKDIESFQELLKLKRKKDEITAKIIHIKSEVNSLKERLSEKLRAHQEAMNRSAENYTAVQEIKSEIDELHDQLGKQSIKKEQSKTDLKEIDKEIQKIEKKYIKDSIPLVDQVLDRLISHIEESRQINELLKELGRDNRKVNRKVKKGAYTLQKSTLRNFPVGLDKHHAPKRLKEIIEYQKKQWEKFKSDFK